MKRAYENLLRLYPADYRARFAREMTGAFINAAGEFRVQRRTALARFLLGELIGLLAGAVAEWTAKLTSDSMARARRLPDLRKMRPAGISREVWFANPPASTDGP